MLRYTEDGCCWFHSLVVGVCGYNTRRIKSLKQLFLYFHAPRILRPVEGGRAGRGGGGSSPQNFWKLKNITINEPKNMELKRVNVQRTVLNADAKSSFYNFKTFNRV